MEQQNTFDPNLLSIYERRILWFCLTSKTRTDIVRRTRNYTAGTRGRMLNRLKRLGLLDAFLHEAHESELTRRPVQYWVVTEKGKSYIEQYDQWFDQLSCDKAAED